MTDQEADRLTRVFIDAYSGDSLPDFSTFRMSDEMRSRYRAAIRAVEEALAQEALADFASAMNASAKPVDLSYVMLAQADVRPHVCPPARMEVVNDVFEY